LNSSALILKLMFIFTKPMLALQVLGNGAHEKAVNATSPARAIPNELIQFLSTRAFGPYRRRLNRALFLDTLRFRPRKTGYLLPEDALAAGLAG
jgi:hypothetical protein